MPVFKFKPAPVNVYISTQVFDPEDASKDPRQVDKNQRRQAVLAACAKYDGQTLSLANCKTGEVRPVEIAGVSGRVWIEHMIGGVWRLANEEDIARDAVKQAAEDKRICEAESKRMAKNSGAFFNEVLQGAESIQRYKESVERAEKLARKPAGKAGEPAKE